MQWDKCALYIIMRYVFRLPTIDANHDHAGKIETDAAGNDGVGGCKVKGTRWVLLAVVLDDERLIRSMETQRDGNEGDKSRQQPNGGYCYNCYPTCHPTTISKNGLQSIHWNAVFRKGFCLKLGKTTVNCEKHGKIAINTGKLGKWSGQFSGKTEIHTKFHLRPHFQ